LAGSSLGILAFLAVWMFAAEVSVSGATSSTLLPSPVEVAKAGVEMVEDGSLFTHAAASLERVLVAFVVGSAIAVTLGVAMGWWRPVRRQLDPVVEFFRPIPPLAWIPLSILWFGVGDRQNEFIIFLGVFFPVLVNTVAAVRAVDPVLIRAGQSLGASQFSLLRKVVIPGSLPGIFTGLRVGLGIGWMALVAAELVAATSGLGFLINDARQVLQSDRIVLGMVAIGIIGLLMDWVLRILERVSLPWYHAVR
jgi:ABC-type nitrate/sulfonate/bicarbonate transport system permease component